MKNKEFNQITSSGFKAPEDYFESFDENIFEKLNTENPLNSIKVSGFKVPNDYFESLNNTLLDNHVSKKEPKIIELFTSRNLIYISGVAATILLLFNLSVFESKPSFDNLETETVENYIADESISSYEIAALLSDEHIEEDLEIDYYINADHIEEYLLNNADIEALMIE